MTQTAIRLTTRVLSGKRVEFTAPELNEGEEVELIILKTEPEHAPPQFASAWEYLQSFEPQMHTPEEWAEIERQFQGERNAWGD